MTMNLKPYPAYKDSGVPWLGEIPEHWTVKPLKRWAHINARVLPEATDPGFKFRYLDIGSVGTGRLTREPEQLRFGEAPSRARRVLRQGDTIVSMVRTYLKAVYYVSEDSPDLVASTGFAVLTPGQEVFPEYLGFLLQSEPFTERVSAHSVGMAYPAIAETKLGSFRIAMPAVAEQAAIVRFLDHADRRIRRYIRAKRRLIALLNEQKQAIIQRAVTRGLDPNVHLKPSGVEWLGEVPEGWRVAPLKSVALVQSGVTLGKNYAGRRLVEYPYLRVANVQDGRVDLSSIKTVLVPEEEAARSMLRLGDVLMTEGGDLDKLGRGCIWEEQVTPCLHQNHIFAVRPDTRRLLPRFLAALLASQYAKMYFLLTGKQTTNLASTNKTTIGRFPVLLPSLPEQAQVLDAIDAEIDLIDQAVQHAQREMALMREYRTRLIADVVTGKLDVREAAARLLEGAGEATEEVAGVGGVDEGMADGEEGDEEGRSA